MCCFGHLWRVSTAKQLGLASHAYEECSRSHAPLSAQLSATQLEFEVPDARIRELANCSEHELSCLLYISIVDTVLTQHVSVTVSLDVTRSLSLSMIGTQTYVPLTGFKVEAQLAYVDEEHRPVFVVVTDMQPLLEAGSTDVLLFGHDLELVQPAVDCQRYAVAGSNWNMSLDAWSLEGVSVRTTSFLRSVDTTSVIKLFYTLRLREREGTSVKNTMHVAVWRNRAHGRLQASRDSSQCAHGTRSELQWVGGERRGSSKCSLTADRDSARRGGWPDFLRGTRAAQPRAFRDSSEHAAWFHVTCTAHQRYSHATGGARVHRRVPSTVFELSVPLSVCIQG